MVTGMFRSSGQGRHRLALTATFARDLWQNATAMNHRFDKRGNAMPLELHGVGCGICARQQLALRLSWEAR